MFKVGERLHKAINYFADYKLSLEFYSRRCAFSGYNRIALEVVSLPVGRQCASGQT